ncbi:MAG: CapA family protein [Nitrososphaerota archaeon]
MRKAVVTVLAVGDVAPMTFSPQWANVVAKIRGSQSIFVNVQDFLRQGDIVFCQLEIPISARARWSLPQARRSDHGDPRTARLIKEAGFNVVSFASNHCMDWGPEVMFDTVEALEREGIKVVGVGKDIWEARKPVTFEVKGVKIGFLAYNSILPMGYWAEENRPGCAPLRAFTLYEPIEHDQPGTPCRIRTFPCPEDLRNAVDDVISLKARVDIVIVSLHWGIHFVPAVLAEYQRTVAYALIDAGADLILGHHAHILKPIEFYKGVAIFYSLGNFATDLPFSEEQIKDKSFREIQSLNPTWLPSPDVLYNCPTDSEKTVIVCCGLTKSGIINISIRPVWIDRKTACPELLTATDPRFFEVVNYLCDICRAVGLEFRYKVDGDNVLLWEK